MPLSEKCPSYRDVHVREISIFQKCPSSQTHACPSWGSVHLSNMSILKKCPSRGCVHLGEAYILEMCPGKKISSFIVVNIREISSLGRRTFWVTEHFRELYNLETGGVSFGKVSILDRHPFQRDVQEGVSLLEINKLCASKFHVTICCLEHKKIRSRCPCI